MSLPLSNVCVAANAADRFNYYLLDGSEDALSSSDTPPSSSEYREFDAHSKLDGFPGSSTSAPPSAPGTGLSSDDVRYPSPPPSPPISSDGSSGSTIYSDALSTLDGSLGVSAISARLSTPGAGLSSYDIRCPLPPSPPISTDGPSGSSIYCDAFSTLGGSPSSSAYSSHSLTHGAGLPSDGAHHPPDGFPSSSARSVRPSMPEKGPPPDDVDSLSPPSLLHLLPFLFDDPSSSSEYSSYPSTAEKDPPSDDFRRPPSPISLPPWPPFSFDSSSGSSEHSSHHSTPGQGPPSDGINRPPSPPSLVPLHSFVLPRSASTSWTLNRSIEYSLSPGPDKSLQLRAKSAVSDKVPTPSLLTEEILAIGDDALSGYEAVRMQCPPEESCPMERSPFSSLSAGDLERYFVAAVDAKNALQLRNSIVAVDIGDALEYLAPKLSMYGRDEAALETAFEDMRLIRAECSSRSLHLDFFSLEFFRRRLPLHRPSVLERYNSLFFAAERAIDERADAQRAAWKYLKDPCSLKEHRLPYFSTSQR